MKLLTKTNIYTTITTVLLFAMGIFVVYQVILQKLDKEVDKQLLSAKTKIVKGLNSGILPNEFLSNLGQKVYIKKIDKQTIFEKCDIILCTNVGAGDLDLQKYLF